MDSVEFFTAANGGDVVICNGNADITIDGGGGDDIIAGGAGADDLRGKNQNDLIYGAGGGDLIDGENDNDRLFGGAGEDVIVGGAGNDLLDGGIDDDILRGQAGEDRLIGGAGNSTLTGGGNADIFDFGVLADLLDFTNTITDLSAVDSILLPSELSLTDIEFFWQDDTRKAYDIEVSDPFSGLSNGLIQMANGDRHRSPSEPRHWAPMSSVLASELQSSLCQFPHLCLFF